MRIPLIIIIIVLLILIICDVQRYSCLVLSARVIRMYYARGTHFTHYQILNNTRLCNFLPLLVCEQWLSTTTKGCANWLISLYLSLPFSLYLSFSRREYCSVFGTRIPPWRFSITLSRGKMLDRPDTSEHCWKHGVSGSKKIASPSKKTNVCVCVQLVFVRPGIRLGPGPGKHIMWVEAGLRAPIS